MGNPLVLKASGPATLFLRQGYLPALFPTDGAIDGSSARIGWHYVGEDSSATKEIGVFKMGSIITIPNNPIVDRDVIVRAIALSAYGVPHVHQWSDSSFLLVPVNRNSGTPAVIQYSPATTSDVTLKVSEGVPPVLLAVTL